jgi:hypothetical protein
MLEVSISVVIAVVSAALAYHTSHRSIKTSQLIFLPVLHSSITYQSNPLHNSLYSLHVTSHNTYLHLPRIPQIALCVF